MAAADAASSYHDMTVEGTEALHVQEKYGKERAKRLRPEGSSQYIDLSQSDKFRRLQVDPWLDDASPTLDAASQADTECQVLILGAGFGGLQSAVRLIEAGVDVKRIRIVDQAGGFGGTWYWNRFPGLMCDIESYIYLPLLEETGYMPKHKYSYGPELREYCNIIARKWQLTDKALFQTRMTGMVWHDESKQWLVSMAQTRNAQEVPFQMRAQFVITASGGLNYPQLPDLPGLDTFQGYMFHTSRWHYSYTGGSPTDPSLEQLKDKTVAIIGTGATAVQSVPHLAKWAKHLYVFQRTPSAVDERGQRPTDAAWWAREVAGDKGWQQTRNENFLAQFTDAKPPDMIDDGFTRMSSYRTVIGKPGVVESIPEYLSSLHELDLPRQERLRTRIEEIITEKSVAQNLKPWYPGWCKRPCFHDDYLPAFNQPNVTLVDTDGKGVDRLTEGALVFNGQEYLVDLIVFSTGYSSPIGVGPAERASMTIRGRNGQTLSQKSADGLNTLHGVATNNFPNLFWAGIAQAGFCPNQTFSLDIFAKHVAFIIASAIEKAGGKKLVSVEPSQEAEDAWALQVAMRAGAMAGMSGCTPSYFNREGEADKDKSGAEQFEAAKQAPWGEGLVSYRNVVEDWRAEGNMEGLIITVA